MEKSNLKIIDTFKRETNDESATLDNYEEMPGEEEVFT